MNIVVFDNSDGKAFRKTRRHFCKLLVRISDRQFVGDLPARIIEQLLSNLRFMVSKNSNILVLVENNDGFHGWEGYYFGAPQYKTQFENFLKFQGYIETKAKDRAKRKKTI